MSRGRFHYAGDSASFIFLLGVVAQYLGYSFAVLLSGRLPMWEIAGARATISGLAFFILGAVILRSRLRVSGRALVMGLVAALMNVASFTAAGALPLGVATGIEFVGPIAVAAIAVRQPRTAAMVFAGLIGVAILYLRGSVGEFGDTAGFGFLAALTSAALWATYILLGHSQESVLERLPGFGVGLVVGGLVVAAAPYAVNAQPAWAAVESKVWLQLAGIAVLASVVPYLIDLYCLSVMSPHVFAILTVLLPAVSALLGWLILDQVLGPWDVLGLILIATALGLLRRSEPAEPHSVQPS